MGSPTNVYQITSLSIPTLISRLFLGLFSDWTSEYRIPLLVILPPLRPLRKYDKERNLWSTVGNLPEGVWRRHWGMTLRGYGDQLILFVGEASPGGVEVYECVPDEGPLQ
ncbi:hypothetical protein Vadar_027253 [Vaccinium darrowii]|uniref:Uncharacterized protein n=1 Tax=Vaccinium darrowii TaxID=229202 RepID=A0ACB7ZFM3_9ERIC|nr:hypothetical protein Vadar_027253 [Vaccinium darrowii]